MTNTAYGKLTAGLIVAWFTFSLSASALHLFDTDPSRPPLPLLLAAVIPIFLFFLWYRSSKSFREFVLSLSPQTLTIVQSWRIAGFAFLALYAYGILPGIFALPAGLGDMVIGATAISVGLKLASPGYKRMFILWQWLGIADLVVALSSGALARFIGPQGLAGSTAISTAPMSVLPLSVIPTFAVPLFLILHIICIAQARRWSQQTFGEIADRAGSLAA
jgi:hypothetical protein